jgi:hypothetical protein
MDDSVDAHPGNLQFGCGSTALDDSQYGKAFFLIFEKKRSEVWINLRNRLAFLIRSDQGDHRSSP